MRKRIWKRVVASGVALVLAFTALPLNLQKECRVQAEETDKSISMGTFQIDAPYWNGVAWAGDYVYYGSYQNTPLKWRVLDTTGNGGSSSAQGGILLQADKALAVKMPFEDGNDAANEHKKGTLPNNQWSVSDIRTWLQGTDSSQFLGGGNFSALERDGIMRTTGSVGSSPLGFLKSVGLEDDTMFLLDAADLSNSSYGYQYNAGFTDERIGDFWWLRSAHANNKYSDTAGSVLPGGYVYHNFTSEDGGVVPAFNLDYSKVLFLSDANGGKSSSLEPVGSAQINEWKLTLLDNNQSVEVNGDGVTRDGREISIPYTYTGTGANQISLMITGENGAGGGVKPDEPGPGDDGDDGDDEGDWDDEDDYEEDIEGYSLKRGISGGSDNIKYYGKVSGQVDANGSVHFTLPDDYNEGADTVYILAEQVNGGQRTDYASQPVEVEIPAPHEHEFPDTWQYNDTEHWHTCIAPDCNGIDNEEREEHSSEEDEELSVPVSCVGDGILWYVCECGYRYSELDLRADYIDEDGQLEQELHDFGDNDWELVRKPTYTKDGEERIQCTVCKQWITEAIDALSEEHDFEEEILEEATCTKAGSMRLTCMEEYCEEVRIEEIPATGHSFGKWVQTTEPTTEKEGVSSRTCELCGKVETRSIPKAVPVHTHDYHEDVWVTDGQSHWYQCDCGDLKNAEEHQWNLGQILSAPTKKQTGEVMYTCTVCGVQVSRAIAKVGTKFSYGKYRYQVIKGKNYRFAVTTLGFAKGKSSRVVNMPKKVVFEDVTYTVKEIAKKAFKGNKKITKIKINNKIEKIGSSAFFRAKNVRTVIIGTGVENLGNHTFCHMKRLKKVIVKSRKIKDKSDDGIFHGISDFTIRVPKGKVSDYKNTLFFTHPENVKSR